MKINYFPIFFFLIGSLGAQEVIDLSDNVKEQTIVVKKGKKFDILIKNMIPKSERGNAIYSILLEKKYHVPAPLNADEYSATVASAPLSAKCDNIQKLYKAIQDATSESTVADKSDKLKKALNELDSGDCTQQAEDAKKVLDATSLTLKGNQVSKGEYLQLIISRKNHDGVKVSWLITFDAGKKGQWITSYGLSFATHAFSNEEVYFLNQQDSVFNITRKADRKSLDFIPSIMFSYLHNNNNTVKWSPTGGIGIDTNKPTAFFGISIFYHYNLALTFGLVAHPQRQLAEQYKEGHILTELIEPDQLHEEPYKINPFFSLTLRFEDNPFQKRDE